MIKKPGGTQQQAHTPVPALPATYRVLDFETTSLDPAKGRIIEIGAVRYTGGEAVAMFNCLVYQDPAEFPITPEVTKLTGHTQEDVLKGIPENEAIDLLISFLGGDDELIVGQNILFDYAFLQSAADRQGWAIQYNLLDTLTIARDRKPYPHKLENLAKYYGVQNEGNFHSAYYDALTCGDVLLAMHAEDARYPAGNRVMDYVNVIGYKRKYGEPKWYPNWVTLKPQGDTVVREGYREYKVVCMDARPENSKAYDDKVVDSNLTQIDAENLANTLNLSNQYPDLVYRVVHMNYVLQEYMPF